MALLTFAKVYGLTNNTSGRKFVRELAEGIMNDIREKLGTRSAFGTQILYDERCAERPGFRIKVACRSSSALAEAMDLPLADGKRRGRTAGGRDAFVIDLDSAPTDMVAAAPQVEVTSVTVPAPAAPAPVVTVVGAASVVTAQLAEAATSPAPEVTATAS